MNGPTLRELARRGPVHFMGVAGDGMCALAEVVARSGGDVSGCDLEPGQSTESLEALGVRVDEGHAPDHLEGVAGLVVSSAVPDDHPEVHAAREGGVAVLKRARALGGWVSAGTVVAVAGTHGKTSTTAMTTEVLAAAGLDPTGFVGGRVAGWGGNLRFGEADLFVVEADEYDRSFHALAPDVAVVTNVEADHLDVYGTLEGVREAFRTFLEGVSEDGRIVACGDDAETSRLLPGLGRKALTYGLNPGIQLRAVDLHSAGAGTRFRIVEHGEGRGEARIGVPGVHQVRNALAAAGAARQLGVGWDAIREGLAGYRGVERRFQKVGSAAGVSVVDDYAHHPTEVQATLRAARTAYPDARIVAVFQPHLYTRTRDFAEAFGPALAAADAVWVTDVYPAREEPIPGVSGRLVADAVRSEGGTPVRYHPDLAGLERALTPELRPGDLVLTLGAGSIEGLGRRILAALDEDGAGPDPDAGGPSRG